MRDPVIRSGRTVVVVRAVPASEPAIEVVAHSPASVRVGVRVRGAGSELGARVRARVRVRVRVRRRGGVGAYRRPAPTLSLRGRP